MNHKIRKYFVRGQSFKYFLRLKTIPLLAKLGHFLGLDWYCLGNLLGREVLIAQVRANRQGRPVFPAAKKLDIVFLTLETGNQKICTTELLLGRILQARGHTVRYILCDQQFPCCEVKRAGKEADWDRLCAKCFSFGQAILQAADHNVWRVRDLAQTFQKSDDWSEYIESSLLKHYHVGVLPEDKTLDCRRNLFNQTAQYSAAIARSIVQKNPDRIVMSHGIYCTWGPARDVFIEAKVPLVTYCEGKKKNTIKFNWTTSGDWWDVSKEWEKVRNIPLTVQQEKIIDGYLQSRRSHSQDARVYNFGQEETILQTRQRLRLDTNKPTFVLFTNVLWDAASAQREILFKNQVDWVLQTTKWFTKHPDKQLVVKVHPAEIVVGTNQPFVPLIQSCFERLPDNIRLIGPEERVNSWSVLRIADLGLVHTSTVGMELPLEGVPCAVVARTHYREKGFTFDPQSSQEYFDLLEFWDGTRVNREGLRILAKRYAYLLFERYQLPFPFLCEKAVNDVRSFSEFDQERLLSDQSVQLFIKVFENLSDSFLLP
jgi:hypothetical protein